MATKKTGYEAPTTASDKKKALQTVLSQLDKNYGGSAGEYQADERAGFAWLSLRVSGR